MTQREQIAVVCGNPLCECFSAQVPNGRFQEDKVSPYMPIGILKTFSRVISDNVFVDYSGEPDHPTTVMVETTNWCNLSCSMCGTKDAVRKKGFMPNDVFSRIVEDSRSMGVRNLALHTVGEPLLHTRLPDMIRQGHTAGLQIFFSTNGMALTPENSSKILDTPLDAIRFSVDGFDKDSYESVRAGGNFERLMANLKGFREERDWRKSPTRIFVTAIVPEGRFDFMRRVHETFGDLADSIYFSNLSNPGGQIEGEEFDALSTQASRSPCRLLWRTMIVNWDGTVTVCCLDFDGAIVVGDVMRDSLQDIWTNKQYQAYRDIHRRGQLDQMPLCGECPKEVNSALRLANLNTKGCAAGLVGRVFPRPALKQTARI